MPALNQNLELWSDRTSIISVPIMQADGVTPYTATTPTAATWVMAVNNRTAAVLTKGSSSIAFTQDAISGLWTAKWTLYPVDTRSLAAQSYYHELSVTDNVGDVVNVTIGTINLQPSVAQY